MQMVELASVMVLLQLISSLVVHKASCLQNSNKLFRLLHSLISKFTISDKWIESGKHLHFSLILSIWSLVLQSLNVSTFWQFLVTPLSPMKESVTVISLILWRLYWPSLKNLTGSEKFNQYNIPLIIQQGVQKNELFFIFKNLT